VSWPAIGIWYPVSLVTASTIFIFYKRHRQFREITATNPGLNRSRYIRLMAISGAEICGTIPLGIYFIWYNARIGVTPYISWSNVHNNYSTVEQVAGFVWKNDPATGTGLELYRWLLVLCAFVFFSFFGFADEARQHYRRAYTTLASRVGYSTFTLQGSSHACVFHLLCSVRPGSLIGVQPLSGLAVHRQSLM
jgi:pheromone a factor receptor